MPKQHPINMSKMFNSNEVTQAYDRWKSITGKEFDSFMIWLGFNTQYVPEFGWSDHTPMMLGDSTSARKKMDALLGPHWYALTKAYMAQEENKMSLYKVYKVWNSFYYVNSRDKPRDDSYWSIDAKRRFSKFLGGFSGDIGDISSWELSPEQKYKADLLLGPHSRTMVWIYFLQHPELKRPPLL